VPSARFRAVARLRRHALRFHKVSVDGSGKCDAVATGCEGDEVVGVVFELDPGHKPELDRCEGLGRGYAETPVTLDAEDGPLSAFTYLAQSSHVDSTRRPYAWYKELVLAGAREHRLPEAYVARIEAVRAQEDPDTERAAGRRRLWRSHRDG
jgi:hypothetical protein